MAVTLGCHMSEFIAGEEFDVGRSVSIDTVDQAAHADVDEKNVCPRCGRVEYMAGTRRGCGTCRGVQGVTPRLQPAPVRQPEKLKEEKDMQEAINHRHLPQDCRHCGKTCIGGQGRASHERHCPENPANMPTPEPAEAVTEHVAEVQGVELTPDTTLRDIVSAGGTVELTPREEPTEEPTVDASERIEPHLPSEPHECTCEKVASVSIDVTGIAAVQLAMKDAGAIVDILVERVIELESRGLFARPRSAEQVRDWATSRLKEHKRAAFVERMAELWDELSEGDAA
jgi:hypothetical protein